MKSSTLSGILSGILSGLMNCVWPVLQGSRALSSLSFGINLKGQAGDRQQGQDRCETFVIMHHHIRSLGGGTRRQKNIVRVGHTKFVAVRNFKPERNIAMHGLLNLSNI